MKKSSRNGFLTLPAIALAALLMGLATPGMALAGSDTITIYTDNYAEDEAISRVARDLIEKHYNTPVELKAVDVGIAFLGTVRNKNSLFMDVWLPRTHASYMKRVKGKVDEYGLSYKGARIGWVVPDYVPKSKLDSIEDLKKPEVAKKLDYRIQGISAGSGEMILSHQAMKTYGLDNMKLLNASGSAMTAELKRAIDRHQWIVVTAWSPHWLWQRYDLRYLKDPKNALGGEEHAIKIANPSLAKNKPKIAAFLKRMEFTIDGIDTMLDRATETSYDEAAQQFIKNHPDLVASWLGKDA